MACENLRRAAGVLLLLLGLTGQIKGQEEAKDTKPADTKAADQKPAETAVPKEQSSATDHTIRLGGQSISYKATASTTLLKNDKDEPTAAIFSVAYTRNDVKDMSQRPIAFVYNGGPAQPRFGCIWVPLGLAEWLLRTRNPRHLHPTR